MSARTLTLALGELEDLEMEISLNFRSKQHQTRLTMLPGMIVLRRSLSRGSIPHHTVERDTVLQIPRWRPSLNSR